MLTLLLVNMDGQAMEQINKAAPSKTVVSSTTATNKQQLLVNFPQIVQLITQFNQARQSKIV